MNKLVIIASIFVLTNMIFSAIPLIFPAMKPSVFMPYRLWINAVLILMLILPASTAAYVFDK